MIVSIYRSSGFALQNFWRNLWLSVITIFILVLTLFTVSLVATLNVLADQAIRAVEDKIDIDIFFTKQTSEDKIIAAQIFLETIPEVKNVRYVSQDEALTKFKESYTDDQDIQTALEELTENPLPASLVVQANKLNEYQAIIQQFEASTHDALVENKNFSDHQLVIDRLSSIIASIYQGGIVVSAIFIIISTIMMFNTIRIGIYSHREELGIMKLVGATNWFIRSPFILEGFLYAVISSALAMGMLWVVMLGAAPYIDEFFTGYNFSLTALFYGNFWYIFAIQFLFSLLLAVGSSMISMNRHLKV